MEWTSTGETRNVASRQIQKHPHVLAEMLSAVLRRAEKPGRYTVRKYLCGVYLESNKSFGVRITATDGHQLMSQRITTERDDTVSDFGVTLRYEAVKALIKSLKAYKGDCVTLGFSTREEFFFKEKDGARVEAWQRVDVALVAFDGTGLMEKVATVSVRDDGPFPDWQRVIPMNCRLEHSAVFNTNLVSSWIKNVAEIQESKSRALRSPVKFSGRTIEFCGEALDMSGDFETSKGTLVLGLNAKYLLDAMKDVQWEKNETKFCFGKDHGPIRFYSNEQGEDLICLLMPVRV